MPLIVVARPPWQPVAGDRWTRVPDMAAAARAIGAAPRRVLLAIGRQEVAAFRAAPQHHYLVRSVEPPDPADLPPGAETLLARGPFAEAAERALLEARRIEVVVAKNSGGDATYGKIAAARASACRSSSSTARRREGLTLDAALARSSRRPRRSAGCRRAAAARRARPSASPPSRR